MEIRNKPALGGGKPDWRALSYTCYRRVCLHVLLALAVPSSSLTPTQRGESSITGSQACLHELDELVVQALAAHVPPAHNRLAQRGEAVAGGLQAMGKGRTD